MVYMDNGGTWWFAGRFLLMQTASSAYALGENQQMIVTVAVP
jgi:hypothetical protein